METVCTFFNALQYEIICLIANIFLLFTPFGNGDCQFELGERELAKIADANVWRPTSMVAVRWSLARHGNNIFKLE